MSTLARRTALVTVLSLGHRRAVRRLAPRPTRPGPASVALPLALLGPAVVGVQAVRRGPVRWRVPGSWSGRFLWFAHISTAAALEEILWRGPVLLTRGRVMRRWYPVAAGSGFVAAHYPGHDRATVPIYALLTLSWTAASLYSGRLRWAIVSHTAYNLLATSLAPVEAPSGGGTHDR